MTRSRRVLTMADRGDPAARRPGSANPPFDSSHHERAHVADRAVLAARRACRGDRACRDALSFSNEPDTASRQAKERRRFVTVDYQGFLDRGARHTEPTMSMAAFSLPELLTALLPAAPPTDVEARVALLEAAQGGPSTFQRLPDVTATRWVPALQQQPESRRIHS
jgi:hypothetical protein